MEEGRGERRVEEEGRMIRNGGRKSGKVITCRASLVPRLSCVEEPGNEANVGPAETTSGQYSTYHRIV